MRRGPFMARQPSASRKPTMPWFPDQQLRLSPALIGGVELVEARDNEFSSPMLPCGRRGAIEQLVSVDISFRKWVTPEEQLVSVDISF